MRGHLRFILVGLIVVVGMLPMVASAQQQVIYDSSFRLTEGLVKLPTPDAPENWRVPVNYLFGKVHARLRITSKPTDAEQYLVVCLMCSPDGEVRYCLGAKDFKLTESVVVETDGTLRRLWKSDGYRFRDGIHGLLVSVRDENLAVPGHDKKFIGGPADYFPLEGHLTVTIIPAGSTYFPPDQFGEVKLDAIDLPRNALALLKARRLGAAMRLLERWQRSTDTDLAREAGRVMDGLRAYADGRYEVLEAQRKTHPFAATRELAVLAEEFRGSEAGKRWAELVEEWEADAATIHAREAYELYAKLDDAVVKLRQLARRSRTTLRDPKFLQSQSRVIQAIAEGVQKLADEYADTPAHLLGQTLVGELGLSGTPAEAGE